MLYNVVVNKYLKTIALLPTHLFLDAKLIYIVFVTFCTPSAHAQIKNTGLPEISNFKRTDYKAGTQNWNIGQDANGTMYFANNDGLLQFDGSSWKTYRLPNNTAIRSLKIKGSQIFVGGYNEFGYFSPDAKGKLKYTSLALLVNKNHRSQIDLIWKIHAIDAKIIFQSFEKNYIFDGKNLRQAEAPNRFQFSFEVNGSLVYQDVGNGLLEYNDGQFDPLPNTAVFNNTEVWGIIAIDAKKWLIATIDEGLFLYQNGQVTPWKTEADAFMRRNSCLGGEMIQNNFIVLNSVLDGMIICDMNGKIIQHINRKKGIQNNTVLSSFVDNRSNLWLGLDNGIAFVNESSPFTYFSSSFELSTVYASAVYDGYLYVATNQGLFYHKWSKPFKEDSFVLVPGTTGQAWNIQVVEGQLFCGHNRGLLQIKGNKIVKNLDPNGYWGIKRLPNTDGYYIGSNYQGFTIFKKADNDWKFVNYVDGLNKSANTFEVDGNTVWLRKDNLVYRMKLSSDLSKFSSVKIYDRLGDRQKGIGSMQRLDNKIYFQSNNKFYTYALDVDGFVPETKYTSMFKDLPTARFIEQDKLGNLWYVFNESMGLLLKRPDGSYANSVAGLSNLTGFLVNDYVSVNTIDRNDILIGLTDGLAHYDASLFRKEENKPKVFIRNFSFPGDTLQVANIGGKIDGHELRYRSNNVKFVFAAPMYENLENLEYSYRLSGFDEKWSNWTNVSIKEYTNLREGDYTMMVKVRNSYGIQSDATSFNFSISPPWYRHWLAYVAYLALGILAIYLTRRRVRLQIRRNKYFETVEQRKIYLEKESRIRQEQYDLEKEIERLQNEKLKIKILSKDKELVNNSLQVVKKNKVLNGIIYKMKEIDTESLDEAAKFQLSKLNKSIIKEVNADKSWNDLEKHIRNVHFDFLKRLKEKHPDITPRELDLSTYLLMNMSTKEIAEIMNISNGGVELARYRLRKKLNLEKKENLTGYLMRI
ncbi:helix-turn-helix and ligand-binding sensor domain-containing protein [Flavobacterium selenitireducens]|uniref:helix-turn-helix and ligand-binding sensor domain-containing protein n=1 Tax=Flavobacterium selenitireducens TaxID=2722704 RepID=UPI00168B29F1|nr:triple tyrosine motif-containing protein [Flavobacterium selenitireducens]MBD3583651.1 regulator [Flavobacterium selenitireducens]